MNNDDYFKCIDCWRVYDRWQLTAGPYEACNCGSRRFKNTWNTSFNGLRRFLTDWKYVCFGEKAYEKRG